MFQFKSDFLKFVNYKWWQILVKLWQGFVKVSTVCISKVEHLLAALDRACTRKNCKMCCQKFREVAKVLSGIHAKNLNMALHHKWLLLSSTHIVSCKVERFFPYIHTYSLLHLVGVSAYMNVLNSTMKEENVNISMHYYVNVEPWYAGLICFPSNVNKSHYNNSNFKCTLEHFHYILEHHTVSGNPKKCAK